METNSGPMDLHLAKVMDVDTRGPEKRFFIALLAMVVIVLFTVAVSSYISGARLRDNQRSIQKTLNFLTECNTPGPASSPAGGPSITGHKCFDDTQNRVSGYITIIDRVTVAADECGRRVHGETTDQQFEDCVKGKLGIIP